MMPKPDDSTLDGWLVDALALDQDERAYLAGLNLAGTWHSQPAPAIDSRWGWLALLGVVAAFLAWNLAAEAVEAILATANLVGLSTLALTTAIALLFGVGQSLIQVSTSPALTVSEPLLLVVALVLLLWPRLVRATNYSQGVLS